MEKEKFFARGYNGELKFSLDFFARLLFTKKEKLSFGIVERKFSTESKLKHPAVLIDGVDNLAFDIEEVQFVKAGFFCGSQIKIMPADISIENDKIKFSAPRGSLVYTDREFISRYKLRVINHFLL